MLGDHERGAQASGHPFEHRPGDGEVTVHEIERASLGLQPANRRVGAVDERECRVPTKHALGKGGTMRDLVAGNSVFEAVQVPNRCRFVPGLVDGH